MIFKIVLVFFNQGDTGEYAVTYANIWVVEDFRATRLVTKDKTTSNSCVIVPFEPRSLQRKAIRALITVLIVRMTSSSP